MFILSTKTKVFFAKLIYFFLTKIFFIKKDRNVIRENIKYSLDLSEGIDLSIFILGGFEKNLSKKIAKYLICQRNNQKYTIIDIGSNIGDKSLSVSSELLKSKEKFCIFSVEPTEYAYKKQLKNIKNNPELSKTIFCIPALISSKKKIKFKSLYSSWRLDKKSEHSQLMGQKNSLSKDLKITSLDRFYKSNQISNLKLIKIDVDGFEYDVLKSGEKILKKYKPAIFIEYSEYLMKEVDPTFSKKKFLNLTRNIGYKIYDLNEKLIDLNKIPQKNTLNIILK